MRTHRRKNLRILRPACSCADDRGLLNETLSNYVTLSNLVVVECYYMIVDRFMLSFNILISISN